MKLIKRVSSNPKVTSMLATKCVDDNCGMVVADGQIVNNFQSPTSLSSVQSLVIKTLLWLLRPGQDPLKLLEIVWLGILTSLMEV